MGRTSLVLLLSIVPLFSDAWSHGYPHDSFGGLHRSWPGHRPEFGADLYDNGFFGSARRAPCPAYKRVRASEWQMDSAGELLTADIVMPDIISQTVSATIDAESSALRVKGLREIRSRHSCLPEGAKVTEDGRYEILEAIVAVPEGGSVHSAEMKRLQGGVRLYVPFKAPCSQYEHVRVPDWSLQPGRLSLEIDLPNVEPRTLRASYDADKSLIRIGGLRSISRRDRECLPDHASVTADGRHEIVEVTVPAPKEGMMQKWSAERLRGGVRLSVPLRVKPQPSPKTTSRHFQSHSGDYTNLHQTAKKVDNLGQAQTPSFPDIVVEELPYDWPEKEANAAEGYFDARGDFYEY